VGLQPGFILILCFYLPSPETSITDLVTVHSPGIETQESPCASVGVSPDNTTCNTSGYKALVAAEEKKVSSYFLHFQEYNGSQGTSKGVGRARGQIA